MAGLVPAIHAVKMPFRDTEGRAWSASSRGADSASSRGSRRRRILLTKVDRRANFSAMARLARVAIPASVSGVFLRAEI
jgi:hypothetical protein